MSEVKVIDYDVVKPPTSEEVRTQAAEAILAVGRLSLVLQSRQEIPSPVEEPVEIKIRHTRHEENGSMYIVGDDDSRSSIVVKVESNPEAPASATVVK